MPRELPSRYQYQKTGQEESTACAVDVRAPTANNRSPTRSIRIPLRPAIARCFIGCKAVVHRAGSVLRLRGSYTTVPRCSRNTAVARVQRGGFMVRSKPESRRTRKFDLSKAVDGPRRLLCAQHVDGQTCLRKPSSPDLFGFLRGKADPRAARDNQVPTTILSAPRDHRVVIRASA